MELNWTHKSKYTEVGSIMSAVAFHSTPSYAKQSSPSAKTNQQTSLVFRPQ